MADKLNTFYDRIEQLGQAVGNGELIGKVEVDQAYAKYQHQSLDLHHPRGGKAMFLHDPMIGGVDDHLRKLAAAAVTEDGSRLESAMIEVVEEVADQAKEQAPKDTGALSRSAHPTVTSEGRTVYDRPPEQERIPESQLRHRGHYR